MSCPNIISIPNTEYIGNSLTTINNNFISLKEGLCDNQDQIISLQSSLHTLDVTINALSALAVQGTAKFWVKFSGFLDTDKQLSFSNPDRYLFHSFNVSSVYRKSVGDYRVFFSFPSQNKEYNFTVSNKETVVTSKYYWAQVHKIEKEFIDIKVQSYDGSSTDPEFVSLVIFP